MSLLVTGRWLHGTGWLERGVPLHCSGRETLPTNLTQLSWEVDDTDQDAHVTSWSQVWELYVGCRSVEFRITIHLSKTGLIASLQTDGTTDDTPLCNISPPIWKECWTISSQMKKELVTIDMRIYRRIMRWPWGEHGNKDEILREIESNGHLLLNQKK